MNTEENNNRNNSIVTENADSGQDQGSVETELFYDGETEQEINSTLPYKLILGLIGLAVGIFFLYIFISSITKH